VKNPPSSTNIAWLRAFALCPMPRLLHCLVRPGVGSRVSVWVWQSASASLLEQSSGRLQLHVASPVLETATAATYEFVAHKKKMGEKKAPRRCPIARAELHSRAVASRHHLGAADVAAPQLPEAAAAAGGARFSPFCLVTLRRWRGGKGLPPRRSLVGISLVSPGTRATPAPVPLLSDTRV
jgi:hypothetical protein